MPDRSLGPAPGGSTHDPPGHQRVAHGREIAAEGAEPLAHERQVLVAEEVLEHPLVPPVVGVELADGHAQALVGIGDRGPGCEIGQRIGGQPVCGTGVEQRPFVREVAVQGRAPHASVLGDGAHRRPRRPVRAVQCNRALDDALAGLLLRLRTSLHPVGASLIGHRCRCNFDRFERSCHS